MAKKNKENDVVTDGSRAINKLHISDFVMVLILVILCATCVVPFVHLLAKSVSSNTAVLANGEEIDFDIVIIAVGVRPNTVLAKDAGADVNRGIVCNNKLETTLKDVYTAGDCCESFDISSGENKILALLHL